MNLLLKIYTLIVICMPAWIPAAIQGGAALVGAGINAFSANRQNKKSAEFSREMYQTQVADARQDWRDQNDYNSPVNQMERFREAGLNPSMIYGSGAGAASGTAGAVKGGSVQKPEYQNPNYGDMLTNGAAAFMSQLYDLEMKKATVDNLVEDNNMKKVQTALIATQGDQANLDLDMNTQLKDVSMDARREDLRRKRIDNMFQLDENARRNLMNSANFREAMQRVLESRARTANYPAEKKRLNAMIRNINVDTDLKQLDLGLHKFGLNTKSPWAAKILANLINAYSDSPKIQKKVKEALKKDNYSDFKLKKGQSNPTFEKDWKKYKNK